MGAASFLRSVRGVLRTGREVLALVDEARSLTEHAARTLDGTRPRKPRAVHSGAPRVYQPDAIFDANGEPLYVRR